MNLNVFCEQYTPLIGASIGAILLLIMGILLKLNRLFIYAAFVLLVIFVGFFSSIHAGIYVNSLAALILLSGIIRLGSFQQKFPLPEDESSETHE
ncbi:MAG: hypothetical protein JEZ06_21860 [Anaerolineaceae bacterium]|nr:hypothetical protein [Anaerolineaceae bacterium]